MILSARFCNPAHTAVEAMTDDNGAVMLSAADTPQEWAALMIWATAHDIAPYVQPVPGSITPLQARRALRAAGLTAAVEAAVAASGDANVQDAWEYAIEFRRDDPMLAAIAKAIGMTDAQVDELFRAASVL